MKRTLFRLGRLFSAKRLAARPVGEIGFASHGWKQAKKDERLAKTAKSGEAKVAVA